MTESLVLTFIEMQIVIAAFLERNVLRFAIETPEICRLLQPLVKYFTQCSRQIQGNIQNIRRKLFIQLL